MERTPFCAIVGPHGAGKRSLLDQFSTHIKALDPEQIVYRFDCEALDLLEFSIALYQSLFGKMASPMGDSPETYLISIADQVNQEKAVLQLIDLDRIENPEKVLSFFLKSLSGGSLMASLRRRPDLNPVESLDLQVFKHQGFNESQYKELLEAYFSSFSLSSEEKSELFERTRGNPLRLRAVASYLQLQGGALDSKREFEQIISDSSARVLESVWDEVSENTKDFLRCASLIRYSKEIRENYLKQIGENDLEELLAHQFLIASPDENVAPSLSQEGAALVSSMIDAKLRGACLTRILREYEPTDFDSYLEFSEFQEEIGNREHALQFISKAAPLVLQRGSLKRWLAATDKLRVDLEIDSRIIRFRSLWFTGQHERILTEVAERFTHLGENISPSERSLLNFFLVYACRFDASSKDEFERLSADENLPLKYRAYAYLYLIWRFSEKKNLAKAQELRDLAPSRFPIIFADSELQILWLMVSADFYESTGQHQESLNTYLSLLKIHEAEGKFTSSKHYLISVCFQLWILGRWQEFFQQAYNCEKDSKFFGLSMSEAHINYLLGQWELWAGGSYKNRYFFADRDIQRELHENLRVSSVSLLSSVSLALLILSFEGKNSKILHLLKDVLLHLKNVEHTIQTEMYTAYESFLRKIALNDSTGALRVFRLEKKKLSSRVSGQFYLLCVESLFQAHLSTKGERLPTFSGLEAQCQPVATRSAVLLHLGFHEVREMKSSRAEELFSEAQSILGDSPLLFLRYRLSYMELLLDLQRARLQQFERRLDEIESLGGQIETPTWELFFSRALRVIYYAKVGTRSKIDRAFGFHFFPEHEEALRLALDLKPKNRDLVLSDLLKAFWREIVEIARVESVQRIWVESSEGRRMGSSKELRSLMPKRVDIRIDQRLSLAKIKSIEVDLKKKPVLFRFLLHLTRHLGKPQEKAILTAFVWKEVYNPLVHDPRIYNLVSELRKILEQCGIKEALIESGGKYHLNSKIRYAIVGFEREFSFLNVRQQWLLEYLKDKGFVRRTQVETLLKISAPALKRDLKELVEKGILQKSGQGRNTIYKRA